MDVLEITVPAALEPSTLGALAASLADAETQPGPAVVLRGSREVFCRGLDVMALDGGREQSAAAESFVQVLLAIRRSDKFVIAAVEGVAYGGGVGLAAACDIVLASQNASFGLPEVVFGLAPVTIWPVLCERMTPQKARRMALAGYGHTAAQVEGFGLVDEVVEASDMDVAVARWVRVARRGQRNAIGALKRHSADAIGLEHALRGGATRLGELLSGTEAIERARAFQRGDAPWSEL